MSGSQMQMSNVKVTGPDDRVFTWRVVGNVGDERLENLLEDLRDQGKIKSFTIQFAGEVIDIETAVYRAQQWNTK